MSELKCQYCNKPLKNQGAKNLHELKCKNNPANVEGEKNDKKKKEESLGTCEKGGQHNFRLLNPKNPKELQAIRGGYTEVCTKCQELL
jgi:hypothetical protein